MSTHAPRGNAPRAGAGLAPLAAALLLLLPASARAERLENQVAVFAALDKVTARISRLEVKLGDTVEFGALKVTPRACYTRPPTELPKTTSFVEVEEVQLDGQTKRIFSGWMLAESPGVNAVEHPVFDVWLTDCQKPRGAVAQKSFERPPGPPGATGAPGTSTAAPLPEEPLEPRRRVRR